MSPEKNINLAQFFHPDLINMNLPASTKMSGVEQLAELFCRKYPGKDKNDIVKTALEREALGPTSMGRGFAFPHARTNTVENLNIALGVNRSGMSESGPDGLPLKVICLLITPRNISSLYLQVLAGLANFARRPGMLDKILALQTASELINLIAQNEIKIGRIITVSDVMSENFPSVNPGDSLSKVTSYMFEHNFDGVPVVDSDKNVIGEITGREILKAALPIFESVLSGAEGLPQKDPLQELKIKEDRIKIEDIMNTHYITVSENTPVVQAAALMISHNVDRVLVVRENKIVGIVTRAILVAKVTRG